MSTEGMQVRAMTLRRADPPMQHGELLALLAWLAFFLQHRIGGLRQLHIIDNCRPLHENA